MSLVFPADIASLEGSAEALRRGKFDAGHANSGTVCPPAKAESGEFAPAPAQFRDISNRDGSAIRTSRNLLKTKEDNNF
jgi:hypothetical protein